MSKCSERSERISRTGVCGAQGVGERSEAAA
ncbi:hypothetical protein GA0074692_3786 [Micromonospora pallida]|uniref:Uncharacterized protein n=1 Tax=Micromonospora pallida TaxID=145854 RepID=A0A1C6SXP0_9ACTN|nr:hypothetical protein GA0074692_3786 [Micromonospora pallida]